eukprot:COSAG01_NODE_2498_length_7565_cov_341.465711_2_plen_115_part_00
MSSGLFWGEGLEYGAGPVCMCPLVRRPLRSFLRPFGLRFTYVASILARNIETQRRGQTERPFREPVVAADGFTYEHQAIRELMISAAARDGGGESKRQVVESPWSQLTSECRRF